MRALRRAVLVWFMVCVVAEAATNRELVLTHVHCLCGAVLFVGSPRSSRVELA